jgi:predicted ABC-type ATPase
VAGPNGAGKTTFAREYLPNEGACKQFVNADLIAAGLSPFAPDTADAAAGRAMLRRLDELAARSTDFALETTLSGTWLLPRIRRWRGLGYSVDLYYLQLDCVELALRRVSQRVREGGHDIPEETVRRRFLRSRKLLDVYKREVDHWIVFDNSGSDVVLLDVGENDKGWPASD